jgi:hypothetical protein
MSSVLKPGCLRSENLQTNLRAIAEMDVSYNRIIPNTGGSNLSALAFLGIDLLT